jgi:hypothetical protein
MKPLNQNKMKQTAVEWLIEELEMNILWTDKARKAVHKAKEMEKEQIIDAYYQGDADSDNIHVDAEQYYNETFKTETIVTEYRDGNIKVETFKSK